MAFLQYTYNSNTLGIATDVNIILPEPNPNDLQNPQKIKYQTLYLLHGYSGNHTDWIRLSSIERYARDYNLAVIMPFAGKSFYSDMVYGDKYWEYISEELPKVMQRNFPLSDKKCDNFVAGLSMGGYGAFKLALKKPENYCAAISLSGVLDICSFVKRCRDNSNVIPNSESPNFDIVFGKNDEFLKEEDLLEIIKNNKKELPLMRMYCGAQDFLLKDNYTFKKALNENKISCDFFVEEGDHDWEYWDRNIKRGLEWLPLNK